MKKTHYLALEQDDHKFLYWTLRALHGRITQYATCWIPLKILKHPVAVEDCEELAALADTVEESER